MTTLDSGGQGQLSVLDFDGDGIVDLHFEDESGIAHGNGDGTFTPLTWNIPIYAQEDDGAIGDINGDGKPDVVQGSDDGLSVWLNAAP